jgi:hypothetical protein
MLSLQDKAPPEPVTREGDLVSGADEAGDRVGRLADLVGGAVAALSDDLGDAVAEVLFKQGRGRPTAVPC